MAVKYLVVGCGSMGTRRINHLLKLQAGTVEALDLREDRRAKAAKTFGIKVWADPEEAIRNSPDAILVSVPPSAHLPYLQLAVDRELHVFVEKPISHNLEGLDELARRVETSKKIFLPGCNVRFHESVRLMKELVSSGKIGRVLSAHFEWGQWLPDWHPYEPYKDYYPSRRSAGGGLDEVCDLDWLQWILGDVSDIVCVADKLSSLDIDTFDVADYLLRFRSGAILSFHLDLVQRHFHRNCKLIGEEGTLLWDSRDKALQLYRAKTGSWERFDEAPDAVEGMYLEETRHFVACVTGEAKSLNTIHAEVALLRLLLGAQKGQLARVRQAESAIPQHDDNRDSGPLRLQASRELYEAARKIVPLCTQTLSKAPSSLVQGVYPMFLQRGEGCRVWDVDGNRYSDYILALGPVTLGYADATVDDAIRRQLADGILFPLPHPLEVELAELLTRTIPCAEMARFMKTGSEATAAAVRVARAYTGREFILYCGYHGWHDWYAASMPNRKGVPDAFVELLSPFTYNNLPSLEQALQRYAGQVAAVIMEPAGVEPPAPGFLEGVRRLAETHGALLIFDEIVTGFRFALGGAQEYFGVTPDLATFGKGMANGMPLAAVVGRQSIMREFEEVFVSSTYGGEALSLAAAVATIKKMADYKVPQYLWTMGKRFQDGFNQMAKALGMSAECVGVAVHPKIVIRDRAGAETREVKSLFLQEMIRRSVLFHYGTLNFCWAHTPEIIDETLDACEAALQCVKQAVETDSVLRSLEGEPYREPFQRNR